MYILTGDFIAKVCKIFQGVRRLHTFLRDNPDARKYLDDALKKHEHHSVSLIESPCLLMICDYSS